MGETMRIVSGTKRQLLAWTPPVVAAVILPVHAKTSVLEDVQGIAISDKPVMNPTSIPKCSGTEGNMISNANLEITAEDQDAAVPVSEVKVIGAGDDDIITVESVPTTLDDSTKIVVTWQGPSSDATTCLPDSTISFEIRYRATPTDTQDETITFNLGEMLAGLL